MKATPDTPGSPDLTNDRNKPTEKGKDHMSRTTDVPDAPPEMGDDVPTTNIPDPPSTLDEHGRYLQDPEEPF